MAPGEDVRHYIQPSIPPMTTRERQVALAVFVTGSVYRLFFLMRAVLRKPIVCKSYPYTVFTKIISSVIEQYINI